MRERMGTRPVAQIFPQQARQAEADPRQAREDAGSAGAATTSASDSGRPASAAPSSTDCGSATVLDAEYVDIDPLRKFCRVGARLEDGDESSDRPHRP